MSSPSISAPRPLGGRGWPWGLLLFGLALLVYWPALQGDFLWDDDAHILKLENLHTLHGLAQIWFQPGATIQYYPLTFTVFWLDYHLWGFTPLVFHLQNVLLLALSAVLLWRLLAGLRVPGAWLASAIFALHPVNVMSVAWMTELKNTLSGCLALGAVWAYVRFAGLGRYAAASSPQSPVRPAAPSPTRFYFLSLVLFALAMFAKTAVSFLPLALVLILWWQRERLRLRDLLLLLPFFLLALDLGELTVFVEQHFDGASGADFSLGFIGRLLVSGRSFWFYLGKWIFPYPLIFIYERWTVDPSLAWQYAFPLAALAAFALAWVLRRRIGKGLFAGLLYFYLSTALPVLVALPYYTRYTFVADHWQYFGTMGLAALTAAGLAKASAHLQLAKSPIPAAAAALLLLALGALSSYQCRFYVSQTVFYQALIERNPACWLAYNNYGRLLFQNGYYNAADAYYRQAAAIKPDDLDVQNNFGSSLVFAGKSGQAIAHLHLALAIDPHNFAAQNNLGNALVQMGLADEAIDHFQRALAAEPDATEAYFDLANAYLQLGQTGQAITYYQKALEIRPDYPDALNNLAYVLATASNARLRNGPQAVALAQRANELTQHRSPIFLGTLAAAYAEAGRYPQAVKAAQAAIQVALAHGNASLAGILQQDLRLYQAGRPSPPGSQ